MRIAIVTESWLPSVNGMVTRLRTSVSGSDSAIRSQTGRWRAMLSPRLGHLNPNGPREPSSLVSKPTGEIWFNHRPYCFTTGSFTWYRAS